MAKISRVVFLKHFRTECVLYLRKNVPSQHLVAERYLA